MWKLGPRRDLSNFWPANVDVLLSVASLSTFASLSRQTVSLISQKCAYISRNIMATSRTVSSKITLKSNLFVCLCSIWTLHTHISLDILFSITFSCFHDTIFFCSGIHLVVMYNVYASQIRGSAKSKSLEHCARFVICLFFLSFTLVMQFKVFPVGL